MGIQDGGDEMIEKMTFFASYYTAIMKLDNPSDRLKAFEAICGYGITGDEPEDLEGVVSIIFDLAKPNINSDGRARKEGAKGGKSRKRKGAAEKIERPLEEDIERPLEEIKEGPLTKNEKLPIEKNPSDKDMDKEMDMDRDMDKGSSTRTPTQEEQIDASPLSDSVKAKIREWVAYKRERREPYKPTGFKSLLSEVYRHEQESGAAAVVTLINECMSNGWRGIIWDRLNKPVQQTSRSGTSEKIHSFEERKPDFSDLERKLIKNL